MGLAIFFLRWHPGFDVIFFYLPQPEIAAAIRHHVIWNAKFLHNMLRILIECFVVFDAFFVACLTQHHLFYFIKFMDTDKALGVFPVSSRLTAKARRK